ncbi:hypothetical protein EDF24_0716 [Curtobacterium sp. PhB130]|uniref:hypothetical protein n=1 Tax=Curtobacterium sp. PhB130 TaxID=2485178 RepID=UPI000FA0BC50|nr:hypothetical protein [Curtobacterium sp. PhB130]ROS77947.1 hypothetical protein EDF24_0716 [Curtobacterium sp. PhB130]
MAQTKTKEAEVATDPATTTYIVREKQKDDSYSETLVVGLAAYKKKWKIDHLDEDDFYIQVMQSSAQAIMDVGIRIATAEDLEKFGDQQEVAKLVQEHTFWDKRQEQLKDELRTKIMEWVNDNVETQDQFVAFLANNSLNTNQFAAIAFGARRTAPVSDEFLDMYAAYVSEKSKGTKYQRTPAEVRTNFYAARKK